MEVFKDNHGVTTIYVYETRDGNVIGYLPNMDFEDLEQVFSQDFSEEEVYDWIDNNIEYL